MKTTGGVKIRSTRLMTPRLLSIVLLASSLMAAQTAKPDLSFFVDAASFSAEGTWIPVDPKSHAAYQAETNWTSL